MNVVYLIGRIAFVMVFLSSGLFKLIDIAGAAAQFEQKFTIPPEAAPVVANAAGMVGLGSYQMLIIVVAIIEIVFSLFIVFNVAIRFSALALAIVIGVGTFYANDFWNMTGQLRADNLVLVIKNVAIIGGLLMLMAFGEWRVPVEHDTNEFAAARQ
jgi:putative oxidoreductase